MKFLQDAHDYIAQRSVAYERLKHSLEDMHLKYEQAKGGKDVLERKLKESEQRAQDSHRLLMSYARELHRERPGLAEWNSRGKFLPTFPEYFPVPLKAEGELSPTIVFDEVTLREPWTEQEIKILARALDE